MARVVKIARMLGDQHPRLWATAIPGRLAMGRQNGGRREGRIIGKAGAGLQTGPIPVRHPGRGVIRMGGEIVGQGQDPPG